MRIDPDANFFEQFNYNYVVNTTCDTNDEAIRIYIDNLISIKTT